MEDFVEWRLIEIKKDELEFYSPMLQLFGQVPEDDSLIANKEATLRRFGFEKNPERGLWFSRDRRIGFSEESVQDIDSLWLDTLLREKVPVTDFVFHFPRAPDDFNATCAEILNEIGLPKLRPHVRLATLRSGS